MVKETREWGSNHTKMVMLLFWRFSFLPLLEDSAASNGNVNNGKVDISLQEALSLGGWGGVGKGKS